MLGLDVGGSNVMLTPLIDVVDQAHAQLLDAVGAVGGELENAVHGIVVEKVRKAYRDDRLRREGPLETRRRGPRLQVLPAPNGFVLRF